MDKKIEEWGDMWRAHIRAKTQERAEQDMDYLHGVALQVELGKQRIKSGIASDLASIRPGRRSAHVTYVGKLRDMELGKP